jgi:hypothetical protein
MRARPHTYAHEPTPNMPMRNGIRVDDETWDTFGEAVAHQRTSRSKAQREFMRWYARLPGAELPQRPPVDWAPGD